MTTVSRKERAVIVLESAHYMVKEIAFSLAMEVNFEHSYMGDTTRQELINAHTTRQLKEVRDSIRSLLKMEEADGEDYWTYHAPNVSTHPQRGMSYSLIGGIDGNIWLATNGILEKDKNYAMEHIMLALVLFDEFNKLKLEVM